MSWIGRIINTQPLSPLSSQITVGYFNDADPRNSPSPMVFLHTFNYLTDNVTDQASFISAVQDEGKRARASYEHTQMLLNSLPLGAQVEIEE